MRKSFSFHIALCTICGIILFACNGESFSYRGVPEPRIGVSIYSASFYKQGYVKKACYFVNGRRGVELGGVPGMSEATVLAVADDSVYVAGYYNDGTNDIACYWVDGELHSLDVEGISGPGSYAAGIAVSGGNVYICGFGNDYIYPEGYYWVNGERFDLEAPAGTDVSLGWAITVADNDVYVAGFYHNENSVRQAGCWKNGLLLDMDISDIPSSFTWAIAVSDNTVYAAGLYFNGSIWLGCYWINGERRLLQVPEETIDMYITGIKIDGTNVHVTGNYSTEKTFVAGNIQRWEFKPNAGYWVNGEMQPLNLAGLTDNAIVDSYTNAIAIYNGVVYVAGYSAYRHDYDLHVPCYWVNDGIVRRDFPGVGAPFVINSQVIVVKSLE